MTDASEHGTDGAAQPRTLRHTKPVLFINYHKPQVHEFHLVLN